MRNPSSDLRSSRASACGRPSPAMIVALRGAVRRPLRRCVRGGHARQHSVGASQLKTFAVTNPKLASNVGRLPQDHARARSASTGVNRIEVQLRLKSTCATRPGDQRRRRQRQGDLRPPLRPMRPTAARVRSTDADDVDRCDRFDAAAGRRLRVHGAGQPVHHGDAAHRHNAAAQHVVVTCTLQAGTSTTATRPRSVSFDLPCRRAARPLRRCRRVDPADRRCAEQHSAAATDVRADQRRTARADGQRVHESGDHDGPGPDLRDQLGAATTATARPRPRPHDHDPRRSPVARRRHARRAAAARCSRRDLEG